MINSLKPTSLEQAKNMYYLLKVYSNITDNNLLQDIVDKCNTFEFFIKNKNLGYIQRGSFGMVFKGCNTIEVKKDKTIIVPQNCVAIKLIPYRILSYETPYDPLLPENVEWIVLKYLRKKILDIIHFPYITYPVTSCIRKIDENKIGKLFKQRLIFNHIYKANKDEELKENFDKTWYRITVLEYVDMGDLGDFLYYISQHFNGIIPDIFIYNVIIQTFLILENILEFVPGFRHNDLALRNILVKSHNEEYHIFDLHRGTYKLKSLGFSLVFNDFDFSEVIGLYQNKKMIEYYYSLGLDYFTEFADVNYFLRSFGYILNKLSSNIKLFMYTICPKFFFNTYINKERYEYATIKNNRIIPFKHSNSLPKTNTITNFIFVYMDRVIENSSYVNNYLKQHNFNPVDYSSDKLLMKFRNNLKYPENFILEKNIKYTMKYKLNSNIIITKDTFILEFQPGTPSVVDGTPSVVDGTPSVVYGTPSVVDGTTFQNLQNEFSNILLEPNKNISKTNQKPVKPVQYLYTRKQIKPINKISKEEMLRKGKAFKDKYKWATIEDKLAKRHHIYTQYLKEKYNINKDRREEYKQQYRIMQNLINHVPDEFD